ncbi:hypothetical protein [Streptomyces misionensis]|uniref:hypothetical protein n=1 Tax=Streptomyces misionensis TaxID=67331 RepID=UPI0021BDD00D|nr:hypothetical protein [Streptomyces misionensis]
MWGLNRRGHGEAKQLPEPKDARVSALRKQEYDPDTGQLLGAGYDDHAAAVTSTAAELHRAGIGHRLGFQTEIGHRLGSSFVQRADLVVRAPAAGVPVLLLEKPPSKPPASRPPHRRSRSTAKSRAGAAADSAAGPDEGVQVQVPVWRVSGRVAVRGGPGAGENG